jgi:hypothetical protein
MKPTTLLVLAIGLAPVMAQDSLTQRDGSLGRMTPTRITSVAPAMAAHPGRVEVRGTGFERVLAARVNGAEVPIVAQDDRRLVLSPPNQDPGFGVLELVRPSDALTETIEFLPAIRARWHGAMIQLRLDPGAAGWFVVQYSFRLNEPMRTFPGVYYGLHLNMDVAASGVLFSGLCGEEPLVFPWMPAPRGLFGPGGYAGIRPMRVQALCSAGGETCYSNMVTLQQTL